MSGTLNFTQYDFEQLVVQFQNILKANQSWKDAYRSGTGETLIEFFAYTANMVLFYIERQAEESYLPTARNYSSVANLVRILNYTPRRKVSATGSVTFTLQVPKANNVIIPKYTTLVATSGDEYVVSEDTFMGAGVLSLSAPVTQGKRIEIITASSGTTNQSYNIADTAIENTNIFVYVDGVLWTKQTSFFRSLGTDKDYVLIYELDKTVTILFGDNVNGMSPTVVAEIKFVYLRSTGANGNIFTSGLLNSITSTIKDSTGAIVTDISVTNPDTILGGEDEESIEEIKYNAPRVFATGDRAVTKADYIAILDDYAGIASSNAWGEAEENPPNYDMFNRVKLCIILQNWALPNTDFKQTLAEYLETKAQVTVKYTYVDPIIVYVVPIVDIVVKNGFSLTSVQSDVEAAIDALFQLGTTSRLGFSTRYSDVVYAIDNTTGVSYSHTKLNVHADLVLNANSLYDYFATIPVTPLKPGTVKIYVNNDQVGVDDGEGNITDLSSTYGVSGTVDYDTGEVGVNFSPDPSISDQVYVRTETEQNGDIVVEKDQICRLEEVEITSIQYES